MNREHPGQGGHDGAGTAIVLLAAGAGTRFRDNDDHDAAVHGAHKLLALLPPAGGRPEETLAARSIASAVDAGIGEVIVVTGAIDLQPPPGVIVRHNPDWRSGQITSLRAGIDEAASRGHHRVVVGLADQPAVDPSAWRAVARHDGPVVVATYAGRRGHPVRLDEEVWNLLPAAGDVGARGLMREHPNLVREVPCTGSPADIDTVEDLRQWQSS